LVNSSFVSCEILLDSNILMPHKGHASPTRWWPNLIFHFVYLTFVQQRPSYPRENSLSVHLLGKGIPRTGQVTKGLKCHTVLFYLYPVLFMAKWCSIVWLYLIFITHQLLRGPRADSRFWWLWIKSYRHSCEVHVWIYDVISG
jgi:hypothetical protein